MKIVQRRTPEAVAVDFEKIPAKTSDAQSMILLGCIGRAFQNPAVRADYERWKAEREQTKGATQCAM